MPITPPPDNDLQQIIQGMLRRIVNLEQANPLQGGAVISGGGFRAIDPNTGNTTAFLGLGGFNDGSGRMQMETQFFRADGSEALAIADRGTVPGHAFQQALQIYDRAAHRTIVSDDTVSGHGLGTPHIGVGNLMNTNVSTWPATNNTSFTTIASAVIEIQNPKLKWTINLYADSGVTAQFQLLINSVQVGTTQTVLSNTFATWQQTNQALPMNPGTGDFLVELQALVSGTGSAHAQCLQLSGDQS